VLNKKAPYLKVGCVLKNAAACVKLMFRIEHRGLGRSEATILTNKATLSTKIFLIRLLSIQQLRVQQ
jgi:hypothetical protein